MIDRLILGFMVGARLQLGDQSQGDELNADENDQLTFIKHDGGETILLSSMIPQSFVGVDVVLKSWAGVPPDAIALLAGTSADAGTVRDLKMPRIILQPALK